MKVFSQVFKFIFTRKVEESSYCLFKNFPLDSWLFPLISCLVIWGWVLILSQMKVNFFSISKNRILELFINYSIFCIPIHYFLFLSYSFLFCSLFGGYCSNFLSWMPNSLSFFHLKHVLKIIDFPLSTAFPVLHRV